MSIETRIQADIEVLELRGEDKPNLSTAAREFNLSPHRLRARYIEYVHIHPRVASLGATRG
jgi:hypothetical protein